MKPLPVNPFVPISRQLLDSSVWEADPTVRVLWITILMVASEPARRGTVDMTTRALAGRANLTLAETQSALRVLCSADPQSRCPEHGGRRLEPLDEHRDWGWRVLNWEAYEMDRGRMLAAARQARFKARRGGVPTAESRPGNAEVEVEVEVEDEVEVEVEGEIKEQQKRGAPPLPEVERFWAENRLRGLPTVFLQWNEEHGWPAGSANWRSAAIRWSDLEREEATAGSPEPPWGANRPPDA